MRVYVAGKFQEKERVRAVQRTLRLFGHTITHDWTGEDDAKAVVPGYLAQCAQADLDGVLCADAFLLLYHPHLRGGLAEFGAALANPLRRIAVVGAPKVADGGIDPHACIFYRLPRVQHLDDDGAVAAWSNA